MHSIISFCLCTLFIAIKCTEASNRGTAEKIKVEVRVDEKVAEIKNNDNLKTIHDLGENLQEQLRTCYMCSPLSLVASIRSCLLASMEQVKNYLLVPMRKNIMITN